jgi:hypothetical protein
MNFFIRPFDDDITKEIIREGQKTLDALDKLCSKVDAILEEQANIRLMEMMEKRWGFKRVYE